MSTKKKNPNRHPLPTDSAKSTGRKAKTEKGAIRLSKKTEAACASYDRRQRAQARGIAETKEHASKLREAATEITIAIRDVLAAPARGDVGAFALAATRLAAASKRVEAVAAFLDAEVAA